MKIGLITPYGGTNLGDAAIQEAVINNIRKRDPAADIRLIALAPELTSQLHGVASFPLTALAVGYYSSGRSCKKKHTVDSGLHRAAPGEEKVPMPLRLKRHLKKFPKLFFLLKKIVGISLGAARLPILVWEEASHFVAACRFMQGSALLVVSGGGQIDDYWGGPWGHPYSLFKWGLIAKVIGARYVFLGVGTCSVDSKLSCFFFRRALGFAAYRSYRNLRSKRLLHSLHFTHNDPLCPDLAWSYERKRLRAVKRREGNMGKTVGVSPIAYLRHNWPKEDAGVYQQYIDQLTSFLKTLVVEGYSILLFTTDSPDRHSVQELFDNLTTDTTIDAAGKIDKISTGTVDELFAGLEKMDYVVASRLHGVLLAHLVHTPVLAISYDAKVDAYMDNAGFPEYCFDIHTANVNLFLPAFAAMVANYKEIEARLEKINSEYTHLLDRQYDLILEL